MELEYWVKVKKPERIKSILVFIWMGLYLVKVLAIQERTYSVKLKGDKWDSPDADPDTPDDIEP